VVVPSLSPIFLLVQVAVGVGGNRVVIDPAIQPVGAYHGAVVPHLLLVVKHHVAIYLGSIGRGVEPPDFGKGGIKPRSNQLLLSHIKVIEHVGSHGTGKLLHLSGVDIELFNAHPEHHVVHGLRLQADLQSWCSQKSGQYRR
jgi:hypothetical protein